jgi:hypothetical protein
LAKPAPKPSAVATPPVTLRVLVLVVLVAAVAAGGVAGWAEWRIRQGGAPGEVDATSSDLEAAARSQAAVDEQRSEELSLAAARLAQRPDLPLEPPVDADEEPAEPDEEAEPTAAPHPLEDALDAHQLELVAVFDPGGVVVARAGGPAEAVAALAASRIVQAALADGTARGAWVFGGRLYRVAAERVERELEPRGVVVVADLVGRSAALQARSTSRADAAYLLAGEDGAVEAVGSTLDRDAGEALVPALEAAGALDPVMERGERVGPIALALAALPYRAVLEPFGAAGDGDVVAARVTLAAPEGGAGVLRMVQAAALAGLLAALLLGVILAPVVTRGAGASSKEIVAAAEAARAGDLAGAARHRIPEPLAAFFQEVAEKRALEGVVAGLARAREVGRGRVDGGGPESVDRRRGAVLVVEMPRYARSGAEDEPREVAERLGRDLARVRRAVVAHGGRVEAALGHRALAVFDGERAAARGLGAGAEILAGLSAPENAFDEPVPPALALAAGALVLGGAEGARTVTGLPVQQAESLLREASSGDLIVAKGVFRELEDELAAAGVEVAAQRGLLTPQPVYLLDAERSARAAAAVGAAGESAEPGLSTLAPGVVLADRFELGERLESGPAWAVFAARDRESDAPVALKALRRGLVTDLGALEAFDGEIRGLTRVVHPALARVVDLGVSEGVPFVASERVDGPSLARLLAEHRPLAAPAALRVARWLAAALGAIHGSGYSHGTLRPEVVVLDPRGHARLTDLGTGLILPPPGVDPAVDRALGSPRYQAPERLAGDEATPAADVYAAGALLVELFSGRPLYGGEAEEDDDRVRARIAAGPPDLPDSTELPDGLAPILARCLERHPSARFAHGGELAEALAPLRADLVTG